MDISPRYCVKLTQQISDVIWREFSSYDYVLGYIKRWYIEDEYWENFHIEYKDETKKQIDLIKTLQNIDGELLLKIAIDLGIETPDFIPSIPVFRNQIKEQYKNASEVFERAFRLVDSDPALAIGLSNSALESIIKDIVKKENINQYHESDSMSKQAAALFRYFKETHRQEVPNEIMTIASSLLNASKAIEDIRSNKTWFHGKSSGQKVIVNPLYATYILNATATIGLFLIKYYRQIPEFPSQEVNLYDDLPF